MRQQGLRPVLWHLPAPGQRRCTPHRGVADAVASPTHQSSCAQPTAVPTSFKLSFQITLPKKAPGGSNPFSLVVWGVDQNHQPYDFTASIRYFLD